MTEKRISMREVRASMDSLFADIYLLGAADRQGLLDSRVQGFYKEKIAEATDVLVQFSCWKVNERYLKMGPGYVLPGSGLEQEDFEDARRGDANKMLEILGYLKSAEHGTGGASTRYYELFLRLRKLKGSPSLQAIDDVVNWVHQSGKLFTGRTGYKAPLTPEFAEILCATPTHEELKKYASLETRKILEDIGAGALDSGSINPDSKDFKSNR